LTAEHLAKMYGFEYAIASDETSLKDELHKMYSQNNKPYILEVFTPTRDNDSVLLQYFKELV
jgi:2-succinyl-5-enolpyruvyl-6-hydroxy-3-cyclohexene-1-carboxylate synthase